MFFHMVEYCDTPQSKERRNWEHKVCLNERAILRLLDQDVPWSWRRFSAREKGDFECVLSLFHSFCLRQFCSPLFSFSWLVPGFVKGNYVVNSNYQAKETRKR